jgi:3-oxoadipate enol-lactonase
MEKQIVTIQGRRLAYVEAGAGQPLVLLHGFCGSSAYWEEVVPLLMQDHRLIIPDLRGHGASEAPGGTYSMELFAEDIEGLLDALGIHKAAVLGHSLGGYITLALAETAAERLTAFGLIHSTAYPDDEKGKEGRLKGMQTIREQGLPVFLEGLVPRLFAPEHLGSMPEQVEKARQIGQGTAPGGAIHTLEGMRERPDRRSVIAEAKVPVLLVAGEHDQIIAPERTFTAEGEHIRQVLIEGAGHISLLEAPERLAKEIAAFLQQRG